MHDHPILNHLRSRRPAMIAELKRLVEHESPSHDKPALDALAELLAGRLSELGGAARGRRQPWRGQPRPRAVSGAGGKPPRLDPRPFRHGLARRHAGQDARA